MKDLVIRFVFSKAVLKSFLRNLILESLSNYSRNRIVTKKRGVVPDLDIRRLALNELDCVEKFAG